ncbi:LTA synthase family protein [Atopobacter phocae]|uniref:LTA synthase family protein n=1 Tax=Atopobacter phocae TaxID=136492 RepID=UPI00046E740C|nr:LTA synthase family protein [Atopobacter phocae]
MFLKFKRFSRITWEAFKQNVKHPRAKYIIFATALLWFKTVLGYYLDFSLGVAGFFQHLILWMNPIAFGLFFYSISLFVSNEKKSRRLLLVLAIAQTILLYSNIIYYREFSDFLTFKSFFSSQSYKMSGMFSSFFALMKWHDVFYLLDLPIIYWIGRRKFDRRTVSYRFNKRYAISLLAMSTIIFGLNLQLAEISRPQLLTRTFDRNYLVKYLGLNFFATYDVAKTARASQIRAQADASEMEPIMEYVNAHYAEPDKSTFGIAKGRNVVVLHLESIQQFLIDYKTTDEQGNEVEALPFLNSVFHSPDSFSFDNLFHQVGQGKSSDAELMLENSIYGLSQGSAVSQYGSDNTFQAAPAILKTAGQYTGAVFHGNVGSFWNRTDSYKKFGYDYFFDSDYYALTDENSLEYGLKDKLFYRDSIPYLEQLPQPFYTKFITVSNHFPYPFEEKNNSFPIIQTKDETVNGYFSTAHYADQALKEFFDYLKAAGLYDNTLFVFYGDHYGISNSRNKDLATVLPDANIDEWGDFDNTMLQRVPVMFYMPGISKQGVQAGINHTYGGQIDILPTMLHLLGIDTKDYAMFGQDLLSKDNDNEVIFRNGVYVSKDYTVIGSRIYKTSTGELLELLTEEERAAILAQVDDEQLAINYSQDILSNDLLRFYQPEGFQITDEKELDYMQNLKRLDERARELGDKNNSLLYKNKGETSFGLYHTDAPELQNTIAASKKRAHDLHRPDYNQLAEKSSIK